MKRELALSFLVATCLFVGGWTIDGYGKQILEDEQLILVAVGAFNDGFYDVAEKQFAHFVRDYSNHRRIYDVYYLLGKTLFYQGRFREARTFFLKIVNENKSFENTDYALFWLAEAERRSGSGEEGRKTLLTLIKRFPRFEWVDYAYFLSGMIDFQANRLESGEASFKKVSQVSKREELIHSSFFRLGLILFRKNDFEGASNYFQAMSRGTSSVPSDYRKNALFWLGEALVRLGRYQEAKVNYQAYYDRYPKDAFASEAYWRIGFCEYRLGNTKEAVDYFQTFKNQFRESRSISFVDYLLTEVFLTQGDFASSVKELNLILNRPQTTPLWGALWVAQYWSYLHLGLFEEADRVFQRLIKSEQFENEKTLIQWLNAEVTFNEGRVTDSLPYYFNIMNSKFREKALFQIGKGYFYENKFREAITNLDILFLEFPNSGYLDEGLFLRGECLVQTGDLEEALRSYEKITRQKRMNPWYLLALTQAGNLHVLRKETDEAEKAFRNVIDLFPHHSLFYHAAFQLGAIQLERENILESISYYSMVLKGNMVELFGEAYFRLGEIFYQQEKYEKALTHFEAATGYFKENSIWFFLTQLEMGSLQKKENKNAEAKRCYKTILDHAKDEDIRKAARELLIGMESPR